jgi:TonB-dependent receptor
VQIDRDTSGEGTYINVRGLSAGFTTLTVNGFAISTSSNGGNEGRGSSLDILPSELFRRLTLSKSPIASAVEGGTAGSVDMQPIGPFDRKGFHINLQAQGSYQDADKTSTPRFAAIISHNFRDTPIGDIGFVLAGAYAKRSYRSEIFNTVGYTTMSLGSACPTTRLGCNSLVINAASAPASNPTSGYGGGAGASDQNSNQCARHSGLGAAGSTLTQCLPGAAGGTSGLSCEALSYAIVPRLVRAEQVVGVRDRKTGMFNVEWRPTRNLKISFDSMLSETNNKFGQYDVMMVVRSYNNNIPINFKLDQNNVLTSGTFGNAYFLNQATDAETYAKLFYRSLSADWQVNDMFSVSAAGMMNDGNFRDTSIVYTMQSAPGQTNFTTYAPGVAAPAGGGSSNLTPLNTGQYVNYNYTPGNLTPTISSNIDLPTYTNWYWNSMQIVPTRQDLKQRSGRLDFVLGKTKDFKLSWGTMVSSFERNIVSWNVSDCAFRNNCTSAIASTATSVTGAVPTRPSRNI